MNDSIGNRVIPGATPPPLWEVYVHLCDTAAFQQRVGWQHHGLVVRHLARADCRRLAALEVRQIVAHHLFGSAGRVGRHNALADPGQALQLLRASTLPPAAALRREAPRLEAEHLGNIEPEARKSLHRWVLRRADTLRRAFFEPRPGAGSTALWGSRFVSAHGRDWYQQCLAMMSKAAVRVACRGVFSAMDEMRAGLAL